MATWPTRFVVAEAKESAARGKGGIPMLDTYEKVCLIVSDELDLLDMPFDKEMTLEELGADSFDAMEIYLSIEDEFDITIEEEEFYNEFSDDATLKSITEFVERKLKGGQA
jgi:acyl carrier protein